MKYKKILTDRGYRYFPDTNEDQFNKWNVQGYNTVESMHRGYFAFLHWLKELDQQTLKEMPNQ